MAGISVWNGVDVLTPRVFEIPGACQLDEFIETGWDSLRPAYLGFNKFDRFLVFDL